MLCCDAASNWKFSTSTSDSVSLSARLIFELSDSGDFDFASLSCFLASGDLVFGLSFSLSLGSVSFSVSFSFSASVTFSVTLALVVLAFFTGGFAGSTTFHFDYEVLD